MPWYVIHTYSGHEKKVRTHLLQRVLEENLAAEIEEIRVPTQRIQEVKDGKRRTIERNLFPGYVFIKIADAVKDKKPLWPFIKQTPGVMGFLGGKSEPTAISDAEVAGLGEAIVEGAAPQEPVVPQIEYEAGDTVRVIEGPFTGFQGQINAVDNQKQKVKLTISIFGRATPLELEFLQVEKA